MWSSCNPRDRGRYLVPLVLLAFLSVGPWACSKHKPSREAGVGKKDGAAVHDAAATAKVKDLQARLDKLLEPISYHYDPSGKPDPFQPFLKTIFSGSLGESRGSKSTGGTGGPSHACSTPLECMDVGQLTLVAIVSQADGSRLAMVQDAAGLGYVLAVGTPVGYRHGKVARILADRVIVTEDAEDLAGKSVKRERILSLHPEE